MSLKLFFKGKHRGKSILVCEGLNVYYVLYSFLVKLDQFSDGLLFLHLMVVGGRLWFRLLQCSNEVAEVGRGHILGQQVDHEPIADAQPRHHIGQTAFVDQLAAARRNVNTHRSHQIDKEPVDDGKHRDQGDHVEPEPQENVYLLVDNVDGQNAHCIVLLHIAGRTESVERTLGQSGEDFHLAKWEGKKGLKTLKTKNQTYHRIQSNSPVPFGEVDNIPSVLAELTAQEAVHQAHLDEHVDQIGHLRNAVHPEQGVVHVPVRLDVADQASYLLAFLLINDHRRIESLHQLLSSGALVLFPRETRDVEEECLEEENETHPLVVGMVDTILGQIVHRFVHTRIGDLVAHRLVPRRGDGEGCMNPTVRVCGRGEVKGLIWYGNIMMGNEQELTHQILFKILKESRKFWQKGHSLLWSVICPLA